jgi:hypothetical protein
MNRSSTFWNDREGHSSKRDKHRQLPSCFKRQLPQPSIQIQDYISDSMVCWSILESNVIHGNRCSREPKEFISFLGLEAISQDSKFIPEWVFVRVSNKHADPSAFFRDLADDYGSSCSLCRNTRAIIHESVQWFKERNSWYLWAVCVFHGGFWWIWREAIIKKSQIPNLHLWPCEKSVVHALTRLDQAIKPQILNPQRAWSCGIRDSFGRITELPKTREIYGLNEVKGEWRFTDTLVREYSWRRSP